MKGLYQGGTAIAVNLIQSIFTLKRNYFKSKLMKHCFDTTLDV